MNGPNTHLVKPSPRRPGSVLKSTDIGSVVKLTLMCSPDSVFTGKFGEDLRTGLFGIFNYLLIMNKIR